MKYGTEKHMKIIVLLFDRCDVAFKLCMHILFRNTIFRKKAKVSNRSTEQQ